jgi:hypothetical protein
MAEGKAAIDEWVAWDFLREAIDDIRAHLKAGSEGCGTKLTADDCVKVLACLKMPPRPEGRPPKNGTYRIAFYFRQLQQNGMRPKDAIADTMKRFACSRATVYAAQSK